MWGAEADGKVANTHRLSVKDLRWGPNLWNINFETMLKAGIRVMSKSRPSTRAQASEGFPCPTSQPDRQTQGPCNH